MSYFKLILFYACELLGSFLNLLASIFGLQPSLELGVSFLCLLEGNRIKTEREVRQLDRQHKEWVAGSIEQQAKENGKNL